MTGCWALVRLVRMVRTTTVPVLLLSLWTVSACERHTQLRLPVDAAMPDLAAAPADLAAAPADLAAAPADLASERARTDSVAFVGDSDSRCTAPAEPRYIKGSNYAGYAFSFISFSQDPNDKMVCGFEDDATSLCLAGHLPWKLNTPEDLAEVAVVGWNLNQEASPEAAARPLSWTVSTVTVAFVNRAKSDLRLQVNQGTNYYCYDLSSATSPVTVKADELSTSCWDMAGYSWDGTGATGIQLVVPSEPGRDVTFDVCLATVTLHPRQHGPPVLLPLASTNGPFPLAEVDVFHP
jgi:hypothetical protein